MSIQYHQIVAVDPVDDAAALTTAALTALESAGLLGAEVASAYDGPAREVLSNGVLVGHLFARNDDRVFHNGEATGPPLCTQCGAAAGDDPDVAPENFEEWWRGGHEPVLMCPNCAFASRWTDWNIYEALVCGDVGIIIHDRGRALGADVPAPRQIAEDARAVLEQATALRWVVTVQHA